MSSLRPWLAMLFVACSFDPSGQGELPSSLADGTSTGGDGTTSATTGAEPATSTSPGETGTATGDVTTGSIDPGTTATTGDPGDPGTTTTDPSTSSTTASDTTTGDDTTGPPPCEAMFSKHIELVADAVVTAPMQKMMSNMNEGWVAFSEVAEQGTVSFTFDVGCSGGAFAVWGRVLDAEPGTGNYDPDSFYLSLDGGPEAGWYYGCQTGQLHSGYHWLRVREGVQGRPCDAAAPWTLPLAPGSHTITLRNREPIDGMNHIAAVARLLITSDPDYVPVAPAD